MIVRIEIKPDEVQTERWGYVIHYADGTLRDVGLFDSLDDCVYDLLRVLP